MIRAVCVVVVSVLHVHWLTNLTDCPVLHTLEERLDRLVSRRLTTLSLPRFIAVLQNQWSQHSLQAIRLQKGCAGLIAIAMQVIFRPTDTLTPWGIQIPWYSLNKAPISIIRPNPHSWSGQIIVFSRTRLWAGPLRPVFLYLYFVCIFNHLLSEEVKKNSLDLACFTISELRPRSTISAHT